MNQRLFWIMSFDQLEILYRIYVTFVYRGRFRVKKVEKERKTKRKIESMEIMRYTENIN